MHSNFKHIGLPAVVAIIALAYYGMVVEAFLCFIAIEIAGIRQDLMDRKD